MCRKAGWGWCAWYSWVNNCTILSDAWSSTHLVQTTGVVVDCIISSGLYKLELKFSRTSGLWCWSARLWTSGLGWCLAWSFFTGLVHLAGLGNGSARFSLSLAWSCSFGGAVPGEFGVKFCTILLRSWSLTDLRQTTGIVVDCIANSGLVMLELMVLSC